MKDRLFLEPIKAVTIGTMNFYEGLTAQGVDVHLVDWHPPVDNHLIKLQQRCDDLGLTQKIEAANQEVLDKLLGAEPIWIGMKPALSVLPGMKQNFILHSGPPLPYDRLGSIHKSGIIGGILHEQLAADRDEALALIKNGGVEIHSCNDFAAVGAGAGIITASMPVNICQDANTGMEGYCLPFEGRVGLGVWGVYNDEVEAVLDKITHVFAPAVDRVLRDNGGIGIKSIIAKSLQMNDDIHTRQTAAGLILLGEIAPMLLRSDLDMETITYCIDMFAGSERWFHPLGMASAMSAIRSVAGTEYSTIVTCIASGGVETGLKVADLGDQWFTCPAPRLTGAYFSPQWGDNDASPYIGDSTLTEVVGMGAFSGAAAPAVMQLRGGTYRDGIHQSEEMKAICAGINTNYPIPLLDFSGPPIGIDIRKVIQTGITPICHGGIISREGGQIGAGVSRFPIQVYLDAMYAFLGKYGID